MCNISFTATTVPPLPGTPRPSMQSTARMESTGENMSSAKSVADTRDITCVEAIVSCEAVTNGKQKAERFGFLKRIHARCKAFPFKKTTPENETQIAENVPVEEKSKHREPSVGSFVDMTDMPPPLDGEDLLESLTPLDPDDPLSSLNSQGDEYNLKSSSVAIFQNEEQQIPRTVTLKPDPFEDDVEGDGGVELGFAAEQGILQMWALDDRRKRDEAERRRRAHLRKQAEIRQRKQEEHRRIEMEQRRVLEEQQRQEMHRMETQRRRDLEQRRHDAEVRKLYQQQRIWEEDMMRYEQDLRRRNHGQRNRITGSDLGGFGGSRYPGRDAVVTTPVAFSAMSHSVTASSGHI